MEHAFGLGSASPASGSPNARQRGPPAWNTLHFRCTAADGGKALRGLNSNEHLDCFAKQIGFIHFGIGQVQRSLVEFIVHSDGGSHSQVFFASILMFCSINESIKLPGTHRGATMKRIPMLREDAAKGGGRRPEPKNVLGERLTTVFVRQGQYAANASPELRNAPDIKIDRIGDLLGCTLADFALTSSSRHAGVH